MELHPESPPTFQDRPVPKNTRLAGWAALVHGLGIAAPVRAASVVADRYIRGNRREEDGRTEEQVPGRVPDPGWNCVLADARKMEFRSALHRVNPCMVAEAVKL